MPSHLPKNQVTTDVSLREQIEQGAIKDVELITADLILEAGFPRAQCYLPVVEYARWREKLAEADDSGVVPLPPNVMLVCATVSSAGSGGSVRELIDWSERVAAEKKKWAEHRARARRRGAQQAQLGAIPPALSLLCPDGRRPAPTSSVMSLALADFLAKGVLKRQHHREERVTLMTARSQYTNLDDLCAALKQPGDDPTFRLLSDRVTVPIPQNRGGNGRRPGRSDAPMDISPMRSSLSGAPGLQGSFVVDTNALEKQVHAYAVLALWRQKDEHSGPPLEQVRWMTYVPAIALAEVAKHVIWPPGRRPQDRNNWRKWLRILDEMKEVSLAWPKGPVRVHDHSVEGVRGVVGCHWPINPGYADVIVLSSCLDNGHRMALHTEETGGRSLRALAESVGVTVLP